MRINAAFLSVISSCILKLACATEADFAYEVFLSNGGCKTEADANCTEFSRFFQTELSKPGTKLPNFEVPCDECVTMAEYTQGETVFAGVIDVIGTLVFPSATKMKLKTDGIIVQGKLIVEREDDTIVDGHADIIIELTGNDDIKWVPTSMNQDSCEHPTSGEIKCLIGKRAVIVAGGTVDIRAFPKDCISWTHLADDVADDLPVPIEFPKVVAPLGGQDCADYALFQYDFMNGDIGPWKGSLGTTASIMEEDGVSFLKVSGRYRDWQGINLDITNDEKLLPCLQPDVDYLFTIKARLDPANGVPSKCFSTGEKCLLFKTHSLNDNNDLNWKTLYAVPSAIGASDNEWFTVGTTIKFTQDDIDNMSAYANFYVAGPEGGVDISIANIALGLPNEKYFPDPTDVNNICQDLILNGDAEISDVFAYPQTYSGPSSGILSVETDSGGNNYLSVKGRVKDFNSIESQFNTECIIQYSTYVFKARVWLHSSAPYKPRFTIRTKISDTGNAEEDYVVESIGFCPESSQDIGWVQCERNFMFTEVHQKATQIQLIIVTEGDFESDIDYDDISVAIFNSPVSTLILDTTNASCWGVGAEIMVTSHTLEDSDTVAVNITKVEVDSVTNTTRISIDKPIAKHTTLKDSEDFAVEVALLSREMLIQPMDNVEPLQPLHGGHMMFLHTTDQAQIVEGVEFRKMGQQGERGRYPLHFHMSENVYGTLISKNTVRDSNQRCYVIHGTHNVTLRENVAFNNFGHCYMVEDGFEQDNHFEYNIGARTKVTPDDGILSLEESDMFASTYWISNPNNYFVGNVGAGGDDTGFWYEFLEFVRGPSTEYDPYQEINPSKFSFGLFLDNVMHSYKGDGFKLYPNGYFPDFHAAFQNTKSYKNIGDGVLLHNSAKLHIQGGTYADNRVQIEIDKESDDVWISDAHIIGYSPSFQKEVEASNTKSHCPANRPNIGIQLHSFLRSRDSKGYNLTNIVFEDFGYSKTGCVNSSAIDVDPEVRDGHFDAYSLFQNLTFPDGSPSYEKINICDLEVYGGIKDLVLEDLTGDLNPTGTEPGSIVSRGGKMNFFSDRCVEMEGSCAYYCTGSCYRGFNIAVTQAAEYKDWRIEAKSGTHKVEFESYFDEKYKKEKKTKKKIPIHEDNFNYERRRFFTATLPNGNFTLKFVDKDGNIGWPTIAEQMWEDPVECGDYIDDSRIHLIVPEPTDECENVVKNHDAEEGTENHWMHTGGDVQVVSPGYGSSSYAIASVERTGHWQGPGQFLDSRCLVAGQSYAVSAKFRLQDEKSGAFIACDINEKRYISDNVCPRISFRMRQLTGNQILDPVKTTFAYPIAETVLPVLADKWNTLYGFFTVTPKIAEQSTVALFFEQVRPGVRIIVDDVIMELTTTGCSDQSNNRNFESGDNRLWTARGNLNFEMVTPGFESDYAMKTSKREHFWSSMEQAISKDCLEEGREYSISAKIKLEKDGAPYDCAPGIDWGIVGQEYLSCPVITLMTYAAVPSNNTWLDVSKVVGAWDSGLWNDIYGEFKVTKEMLDAPKLTFYFQKLIADVDMIVDNIVIKEVADFGCDDLIKNGNAELNDKPLYWAAKGAGNYGTASSLVEIKGPGHNSTNAIACSERSSPHSALIQTLNNDCVQQDVLYQVKSMLKTSDAFGGGYSCDVHQTYISDSNPRCPVILIAAQNSGGAPQKRAVGAAHSEWDGDGWNEVSGNFTFFPSEIAADALWIEFVLAQAEYLLVDDVSLKVAT